MQLSAANLLLASQQPARTAASTTDAQAKFSDALAREEKVGTADFQPIEFKPAVPVKAAAALVTTPPPAGGATRLGANIDIRV